MLAPETWLIQAVRNKHGDELEIRWQEEFGYDFDCLTQSEARYLERSPDADAIRNRLYFGRAGKCLVRYDNESGKGDHRHITGREESYLFTSVARLRQDFEADIKKYGGKYDPSPITHHPSLIHFFTGHCPDLNYNQASARNPGSVTYSTIVTSSRAPV